MTVRLVLKADRGRQVSAELTAAMDAAVAKVASQIEVDAVLGVVEMQAIDTGNLLASIGAEQVDPSTWRVFAAAEYAAYVDQGTTRMHARPYFTRAVDKARVTLAAEFRRIRGVS